MKVTDKDLRKSLSAQVNRSGYPLQSRLEHEVRATRPSHLWDVVSHEQPWRRESSDDRYIDLVLKRERVRIVVECKRPQSGWWVFQCPRKTPWQLKDCRDQKWMSCFHAPFDTRGSGYWRLIEVPPGSWRSEFCTVTGSNEGNTLERRCKDLPRSVEGFATEEWGAPADPRHGETLFYFPVLVTTSELYVCEHNVEGISLADGRLDGTEEFEQVSMVRLHKTLSAEGQSGDGIDLDTANARRERSILIVNADYFITVLRQWPVLSNIPELKGA
jgi:hypothetical protein